MRNVENSSEDISRYGSGIGAQTNIDPRGLDHVPTDAVQSVDERVATRLVDHVATARDTPCASFIATMAAICTG